MVDVTGSVWTVRQFADGGDTYTLDWSAWERAAGSTVPSRRAAAIARAYIAHRLAARQGQTVSNDWRTLRAFMEWYGSAWMEADRENTPASFGWNLVSEASMRGYLDAGRQTPEQGVPFSRMRVFYRWGVEQEISGFSVDVLDAIEDMKAPGNLKGRHLDAEDPEDGAFDADEQQAIADACVAGKGRDQDRAVVMLHLEIGFNPNQYVRLRNGDIRAFEGWVGIGDQRRKVIRYQAQMPRNKKGTVERETVRRPLSDALGALLDRLRRGGPADPVLWWVWDSATPGKDIRRAMRRFASDAGLVSPRTGEQLHIFPRRFRYTLATDAADEGASPIAIAALLDHTDTQTTRRYVERRPTIAKRMAAATDHAYSPLVQRFKGVVVDRDARPPAGVARQVVPGVSSHLPLFPLDIGGVGLCGRDVRKDGLCKLFPPLSCYLCDFFMAWRDGPHEVVLQAIEATMESLSATADPKMPAQLEWVRGAVRQLRAQIAAEASTEGQ